MNITLDGLINNTINRVKQGATAWVQYSYRALILSPENGRIVGNLAYTGMVHHLGLDESEIRSIMINCAELPKVTFEVRGMNLNEREEYLNEYRGMNYDGKWEYGGIDDKHHMIVKGFCYIKVIPNTIGKSTYCRDKNGKVAYTDDIVLPVDSTIPPIYKRVKYLPKKGKFVMESVNAVNENPYYDLSEGQFKIVGNIWEHAQLLDQIKPKTE